ncbi:MAG: putative dsRNA-binding protein [Turicibacter sanguinis]
MSETGPAHNRSFEAIVLLDGITLDVELKTKKEAEQQAAKGAIEILAKNHEKKIIYC